MGLPKGGQGKCKGCGRLHKRPWGKYCAKTAKAKAHAIFEGVAEEQYHQYLFLEVPTDCHVEVPLKDQESDDEDKVEYVDDQSAIQALGAHRLNWNYKKHEK